MGSEARITVRHVIGPQGEALTMANLPPPDTKRWIPLRKAEVVTAVQGGLLSLEEACERYALSVEEFRAWQRAIDKFGLAGLRTVHLRQRRRMAKVRSPIIGAAPPPPVRATLW